MAEIAIRLTQAEQEFVAQRMAALGTGSLSEYVSGLLKAERRRLMQEEFAAFIREGHESGSDGPMTKADWADIHREIAEYDRFLQEQRHVRADSPDVVCADRDTDGEGQ